MLLVIDAQNDYLDQKQGKKIVKNADQLVPGILAKIKEYEEKRDHVFYTLNIHENMDDDTRTKEEKMWGQSIYSPLREKMDHHIELQKIYYGITPETACWLKQQYKDEKKYISRIEVIGVETHICVLSNAIVMQNMFPDSRIVIDSKLCTSNDRRLHEKALEIMQGLNMEVI